MTKVIEPVVFPIVAAGEPGSEINLTDDGALVRRSVLPGGIRVISQQVPAVRSVAIGAWIAVGSRDESAAGYGSTHYLEHLLFKGTATRSALEIANTFDQVGGESNAVTAKEFTCYHARTLQRDMPAALEVILDMVTAPALRLEDFQMEQTVILEELAAAADDPADVAHEAWAATVFGEHPLGRPVGGTPDSVRATSLEHVRAHYEAHYSPRNLVVTAAGAVEHDDLVQLVMKHLASAGWDTTDICSPAPRRRYDDVAVVVQETHTVIERDIEQSHVLVGTSAMAATDPQRPVMSVLLTILGGGMSSRLFQQIREQRGLAYSTYAFDSAYTDRGAFAMYAACAPRVRDEVIGLMYKELERLACEEIPADELTRCQHQLRGGIGLGLEDTASRMFRLGRAEVVQGHIFTVADMLKRIEAVTASDIATLAGQLLTGPRLSATVGRVN